MPRVREFEGELRAAERSPALIRGVRVSLSSILQDAIERGLLAQNVVLCRKRTRRKRAERQKLKVGVDIPSVEEIRQLAAHLSGRWCPRILTAAFTGLRASELRGLHWEDVDLKPGSGAEIADVVQDARLSSYASMPVPVVSSRSAACRRAAALAHRLACRPL